MFRKNLLLTALCASTLSLSGCSSMWNAMSDFSADMAEVTKFSFLRGSSKSDDISFAEAGVNSVNGVYKTDVGEYVPTETITASYTDVDIYNEVVSAPVDTSPIPCPEGTYITEEETCMSLDVDTFDFAEFDAAYPQQVVDTSQHECPEDTYLNDKNACMYFETETFDFEDEVSFVEQVVDTSPLPCPDGSYLTAEETCMVVDVQATDVAFNEGAVLTEASAIVPVSPVLTPALTETVSSIVPANAFASNISVDCPEGFMQNTDNSCIFIGADLQE